ncbi:HNH endonuclease signature motif containing protein, partial [Pseudonocardia autotrophica]
VDDPRTLEQRRVDLAHQLLQGTVSITDLAAVREAVCQVLTPDATGATDAAGTSDAVGAAGTADAMGAADAAASAGLSPEALAEVVAQVLAARADPVAAIGRKPLIQVVVSLDTLLGDDRPAELVGHGPIRATTARALAAGGVWARLVVDPLSGEVRDRGRSTYAPPDDLADLVRARDGICRGPLCSRPIRDLDHLVPWADGGMTDAANLHGLCLHHHKLKDAPGWQVVAGEDGSLTWISPCGRRETTRPHDYRTHLTNPDTAPPPEAPEAATADRGAATADRGEDDAPPF